MAPSYRLITPQKTIWVANRTFISRTLRSAVRWTGNGIRELRISVGVRGVLAAFQRLVLGKAPAPKIGVALGGGFARGIAHAGVLEALERHGIPIYCVTGVSAGAIVAATYASGAKPSEIAQAGCAMRFQDVARWSLGRMGLVASDRMHRFLEKLLRTYRFEAMTIPLGVVATDLAGGCPVDFHGSGDVFLPVRASCSYPGLFRPVPHEGRLLVDGAMSVEVPAMLARKLGATHVISVHLPALNSDEPVGNMFRVVNRCFQILQSRTEKGWRSASDLVISPDVRGIPWDGFGRGTDLVRAGDSAATASMAGLKFGLPRLPAESREPTAGKSAPAPPPRSRSFPTLAPSKQLPSEPSL